MADEVLLEQVSPNGNIEAVVEQDERVAFFYLRGVPEIDLGLRSCWVRNIGPAPTTLAAGAMKTASRRCSLGNIALILSVHPH